MSNHRGRPRARGGVFSTPITLVLLLLVACGREPVVAPGTPEDLEILVLDTLEAIEDVIPTRAECLRDLMVTHARELEDRAEYRTDSRTVVLRVPATAPELEFSLAHEIAHHLELTCDQTDMRTDFLAAQGHDPYRPWFEGGSWETTPSEQFATAFATLVTGRTDPHRRITLSDTAMEVVERWAGDGMTTAEG